VAWVTTAKPERTHACCGAGPLAAASGVRPTEFAAAVLVAAVPALCLIPRDIRAIRGDDPLPAVLTSSDPAAAGRG
jgi:hypothetical protein